MSDLHRICNLFDETQPFEFASHCMGAAYIGSTSHNTYVPKDNPDSIDDIDIMGIVVPPIEKVCGLTEWQHWVKQHEELDLVFYSLRKVVGLLLKGNPNVVGLLWLPDNLWLHKTVAMERLIRSRTIFSSRRSHESFVAYGMGQIDKMEKLAFKGYMGAKRKELVTRVGYDAKNAAHAILRA